MAGAITTLFGRPRFKPALAAKWCGLVWAYPLASAFSASRGLAFAWTIADAKVPGRRRAAAAALAGATVAAG